MSEVNQICEDCPFAASLEVGKGVAERTPNYYQGRTQKIALGSIAQDRMILEGLVKVLGCEGPKYTDDAFLVCPHSKTIGDTRGHINGPNTQARAEFNYPVFVGDDDPNSQGQYL